MSEYTAAVVGTGPDPETQTVESFAMGYRHAEALRRHDQVTLVGGADLVADHAEAFGAEFDCAAYEGHAELLEDAAPDVVSVATPPTAHADLVVDLAEHDAVSAVHVEKPLADTWGGAKRMVETCKREGVQLTVNRQRRFAKPFTEAKRLLEAGEIGDLRAVEITWGDFFDTGAHSIDLAGMFAGDPVPDWVLAALDYREADRRFGVHQENQILAQWAYDNGIHGRMTTGPGAGIEDAAMTLRGTEGTIRIAVADGPTLELARDGEREAVDVDGETIHGTPADERFRSVLIERAVADAIRALDGGEPSALSGEVGLNTAEIIFGGYESVRRRARVEFPLEAEDNAFLDLVERGEVGPGA